MIETCVRFSKSADGSRSDDRILAETGSLRSTNTDRRLITHQFSPRTGFGKELCSETGIKRLSGGSHEQIEAIW
jgi:hypothetical protein